MQIQSTREAPTAQKKRLGPKIKILAAVLAVLLLILIGIRLFGWMEQRSEARVMVLVNPWNSAGSADFVPKLSSVDEVQVDESCAKPLRQMLEDCRAAGYAPRLSAGYRSREEQLQIFQNEVDRQTLAGMDADTAYALAEQTVGAPGTSEHELGLAVDVEDAAAQGWLAENCWRYGFILRYPAGSQSITGRADNPAHFRFVGLSAAEQIHTLGITLEEYMGLFYTQEAEIVFE